MLMNRIGRKKTVLLSLVVTLFSLLLPLFGDSYTLMLLSFSLLGIGNALMQTSLNPLVSSVIRGGNLASTLTFGQFVKAIASFMAPYIAMWGAMASIMDCVKLLSRPVVLLCFIGIMCHVGIDVGTNTTAPKILMERHEMTLNDAAFATSLYFIFRTIGCLTGSFFLRVMSNRLFFLISVVMMALAMAGLGFGTSKAVLYTAIALVGYGNSNIFSLVFSQALLSDKSRQNEISGLMIMGLFGGTVFPLAMGVAADAMEQLGAVAVMAVGVAYLLLFFFRMKK